MSFAERLVKSLRNRTRVQVMLGRGAITRALMPVILKSGKGLSVGRNVDLVVYGELVLGRNVTLSDGCALEIGPKGRLVIGDDVFIGRHSVVVAQELVALGSHALVAEHCTIRDQDHHVDPLERLRESRHLTAPVHVGPNVWLGAGVRVLRGSQIGEGSVVAANAVVRGVVPPRVVVGGIPARVLRTTEEPPSDAA